ncbi:MAG: nucleotidyl transferase AbiEii/AbiGii toxin family protein [Vicinamibacteria bacterium]|nr:nucleotidyl transferase AbiEii/AbiGii toxin family protein [Vicinamibacteria bacterium]
MLRLYALECLVARIALSRHADRLALKGGVLLAAFDVRRPTRDVDLAARQIDGDVEGALAVIREIATLPVDDGVVFDAARATAEPIRDEDRYGGVRVRLDGQLATARLALNVDVSVGDPVAPEARSTAIPKLLGGTLQVRCYPLTMVLAEKLVTALERGTVNTRWRDFLDIAALARAQAVAAAEMAASLRAVAEHRGVELVRLSTRLAGFAEIAQPKWLAWRRKHRLEDRCPEAFASLLSEVIGFADPILEQPDEKQSWDPRARRWA